MLVSLIEKAVNRMAKPGELASPVSQDHSAGQELELAVPVVEHTLESSRASVAVKQMVEPKLGRRASQVTIDLERLASLGFLAPDAEKTQIAEEFRVIKRPLITNIQAGDAPERHRNLIMVTSSLPGEGKSFCALNLALSIAMERDITVMLVDADVAKPSVLNNLGVRAEAGLMDLLLDGSLQVGDVLLRTNIEKFSVLPAGRRHKHATELLASEAMARLLDEIATRYPDRVVIFDSPPLLVTSEARELAAHMGQIVMVVEAGRTSQDAVNEALNYLQVCDIVNLLMNKTESMVSMDGYGGYGYGYGHATNN
jgi:receptor protein-tyrosine kinase